ncbi:MAG: VOC family protein [Planctomycetes bacterium]|nr:VOC family protein [Planctomycetota bacterium]
MNIEHVAINVADPVAMAKWYVAHLGMRVVRSVESQTFTHFLADETDRVVIEMYHHAAAGVPDYFAMNPLVLHIAFRTADMKAARERLLAAGATAVGDVAVTPAGDELAMLRDPWGVPLQLVRRARPLLD